MMIKSVKERKSRILLAGVLALLAQGALSEESKAEVSPARPAGERPDDARAEIEVDTKAYLEALDQRLKQDLKRHLEAIAAPRIELVIAEVPTRG